MFALSRCSVLMRLAQKCTSVSSWRACSTIKVSYVIAVFSETWVVHYMASSMSGQDNRILRCDWLPVVFLPARDHVPAVSRKKTVFFFHVISPLLTKLVRSRWLVIGPVQKKQELGQYAAILT